MGRVVCAHRHYNNVKSWTIRHMPTVGGNGGGQVGQLPGYGFGVRMDFAADLTPGHNTSGVDVFDKRVSN